MKQTPIVAGGRMKNFDFIVHSEKKKISINLANLLRQAYGAGEGI
jgi:hypothetical protein